MLKSFGKTEDNIMKMKDKRVKVLTEVLQVCVACVTVS